MNKAHKSFEIFVLVIKVKDLVFVQWIRTVVSNSRHSRSEVLSTTSPHFEIIPH